VSCLLILSATSSWGKYSGQGKRCQAAQSGGCVQTVYSCLRSTVYAVASYLASSNVGRRDFERLSASGEGRLPGGLRVLRWHSGQDHRSRFSLPRILLRNSPNGSRTCSRLDPRHGVRLGSTSDTVVRECAEANQFVFLTKDKDFVNLGLTLGSPPKVILLYRRTSMCPLPSRWLSRTVAQAQRLQWCSPAAGLGRRSRRAWREQPTTTLFHSRMARINLLAAEGRRWISPVTVWR